MKRRITISNPDKFLDFTFSIKGQFIQCTAIDIKDDWYEWRWEGVGGWNYPALFIRIVREAESLNPMLWKVDCWKGNSPYVPMELVSQTLMASGDVASVSIVERKFLKLLEAGC